MSAEELEKLLYNNRYAKWEFDLTVARSRDEPTVVNLIEEIGQPARRLYVLRADDTAYIALNSRDNPYLEAVPGLKIENFYINSFYIWNPASATAGAKLVVVVFWRA